MKSINEPEYQKKDIEIFGLVANRTQQGSVLQECTWIAKEQFHVSAVVMGQGRFPCHLSSRYPLDTACLRVWHYHTRTGP